MKRVPLLLRAVALLPLLVVLSAEISAADPGVPASTLRAEDLRVASVGHRLAVAGRAYCADTYPATGLLLHHLPEYDNAGRAAQAATYRLDRGPGVLAVVADSPAARSGLRAGDVLLDVNGRAFPDPRAMAAEPRRATWRRRIEESEALLEGELRQGPVRLRVLRGGGELHLRLNSVAGCALRVRVARSKQLNAFSDGRYVILTTRLLGLIHSDDELATVIGHELAHVVLGHDRQLDAAGVPTGVLRGFGKNAARVRRTEDEADRLGLTLAWVAGYDATAALTFWERLHAGRGDGFQLFRTHPSLDARRRTLNRIIAELGGSPEPPSVPEKDSAAIPPPGN